MRENALDHLNKKPICTVPLVLMLAVMLAGIALPAGADDQPASAAASIFKPPPDQRWEYLILAIEPESENIFFGNYLTSQAEDDMVRAEITHLRSHVDWANTDWGGRILLYMTVLGQWGWEAMSFDTSYMSSSQYILMFKRQIGRDYDH